MSMPDRAIAPLEELARKWREESQKSVPIVGTCADELEPLLPALASRFRALEAEIAALKPNLVNVVEECRRIEEELRRPMACGHPKACQKPLRMADNLDEGPQLYECAACEQLRLERAAALREAAATICTHCDAKVPVERDGPIVRHWTTVEAGKIEYLHCYAHAILALFSDSDRSALEAHDAEVRLKELEYAIEHRGMPVELRARLAELRGSK